MIYFNKKPGYKIYLTDPRNGKWSADVTFNGPYAPKAGDVGFLEFGAFKALGWVKETTNTGPGQYKSRIIAGVSAPSNLVSSPEDYIDILEGVHTSNTTAYQVLQTLLKHSETNDVLQPVLSNPALMTSVLQHYDIPKGNTAKQLDKLLENFSDSVWRCSKLTGFIDVINLDGVIPTSFPSQKTVVETSYSGDITYRCIKLDKYPEPGTLHPAGWIVEEVTLYSDGKKIEFTLHKKSLSNVIRDKTTDNAKLLSQHYECSVSSQNPDGTLNLIPVNTAALGGSIINVPYETVPGLTLEVLPGTKCTIAFKDGNSKFPYVYSFGGAGLGSFTHVLGTEALASYLARADITDTRLSALEAKINEFIADYKLHVHTSAAPGSPTTPAVSSTVTTITPGTSTACATLKAE